MKKRRAFATTYGSAGGGSLHGLSAYNRRKMSYGRCTAILASGHRCKSSATCKRGGQVYCRRHGLTRR